MNTPLAVAIWLCPALIPPVSYLAFRFVPHRAVRIKAYVIALLSVMIIDMFRFSLTQDWLDTIVRMMVLYMLAETFWLFTLLKNRKIAAVILVAGLAAYSWGNFGWIKAGPSVIPQMWNTWIVDRYHAPKAVYVIKERRSVPAAGETARVFRLAKLIAHTPLEQTVKSYTTTHGYLNSAFSFIWHEMGEGVRVDVMVDGGVIWTLGEKF